MTLTELVAAGHTAIVTQEVQGAVVGPDAGLAALRTLRISRAMPRNEPR